MHWGWDMKLVTGLLAAVVLLAGVGASQAVVRIADDRGGRIGTYVDRYQDLRSSGETVIIDGLCASACTIILGAVAHDKICVTSQANLGFHAAWDFGANGRAITNSEATNSAVIGFNRVETPLVEMRVASPTNREPFSFNGAMDPTATATNNIVEPLTRSIRLVHFRYFDGNEWLDAWNGVDLPMGVEVTFGTEAPAPEEEEEYGGEIFRRIIFVPAAKNSSVWEELP